MTKRILTGIRPTGPLHLGHYVGALKTWVELQKDYECFFLIADLQALTTHADKPALIEESVREVLLDFIGVGLNPNNENVNFVLQSSLRELTELTFYFTLLVPFSEIEKNPTIKAERSKLNAKPTAGFMIYPISQAADILLFTPSYSLNKGDELLVPVGEDQIPHLEQTNRIAKIFNQQYQPVFLECTPKVGEVGRLPGTDGKEKMSKSLKNVIQLKDTEEEVENTIKSMFTDPLKIRKNDVGHPDTCPVYYYHQTFSRSELNTATKNYCQAGKIGCVECKCNLSKTLNSLLDPMRIRRKEAENQPLDDYLCKGTKKAHEIAENTMQAVRDAMHLNYPTINIKKNEKEGLE